MTRDEIMALTPEQLRVEIAKAKNVSVLRVRCRSIDGMQEFFEFPDDCPNWPTNISAAWELVEEMHNSGYYVRLSTPFAELSPYFVKIDLMGHADGNPPPPGCVIYGDTAPLAICRAWLMWKQEEK